MLFLAYSRDIMGNNALLIAVVKKLGKSSIGITKAVITPYSKVIKVVVYPTLSKTKVNIIGSKTQEGYAEILNDTFENLIKDAYETQPEDVVAKLIAKNEYKGLETTDLYEAMDEEGLEYSSKKGSKAKLENIIFIVVFSAAIIGLGTLIYLSRKK